MTHFSITNLFPVLIWAVLVIFFLSVCFAVQDGVARLKRLHQIPCSRCVFYTGSHHLKCTLHPCKALSEEAIACLDYESLPPKRHPSRQPRKPLKKWYSFGHSLDVHQV